jgi:hypothetical protein
MFIRNCPSCQCEIIHTKKYNCQTAIRKGQLCKKCTTEKKYGRKTIIDKGLFSKLYSQDRLSVDDIAKHFNVSKSYVKNFANDNNINRRDYDTIMESKGLKRCHNCNTFKNKTEFHKSTSTRDGLTTMCKECSCIKTNKWKCENEEKVLQNSKEYSKRIKESDPEKFKEWRRNGKKNYRNSEKGKWDSKCRTMLRKVLSKMELDKNDKTSILLGYSPKDLQEHLKQYDLYENGNYEIDHKVPISFFNVGTPVNIVNSLSNLWLTSVEYNQNKSNKWADAISEKYYYQILPYIKERFIQDLHLL